VRCVISYSAAHYFIKVLISIKDFGLSLLFVLRCSNINHDD
tara:strand:+ start:16462 stop:16584 length:123 start_codon:yes stop_codon:yes gene_type:complete